MRKWLFKVFGDGQIFGWIFGAIIAIQLCFYGFLIWIAYHFITKFW